MNNFKKILSIATLTCACTVAHAQWATDSISEYDTFGKYRIGGYGEIVGAFKDYYNVGNKRYTTGGTEKRRYNTISIPRFVLAGDVKFTSKWILGVEIEFESGGVGTSYELENNSENGEYETEIERGGEVALEQFHITRLIDRAFNVRVGHIIVPVGQINAHHEPNNFFGTVRPEGERSIIPNTWHETGLELFGRFGKRYGTFNYQAMVVSGLNANGFDKFTWAAGSKQGIFEEENFTCPGYAARLDYIGVPGLRFGASFYYCHNVGGNSDKDQTYGGYDKMPVFIYNLDAQYKGKYIEARASGLWGHLKNSEILTETNNKLSNKSPYSRQTPVADKAVAYGGELGINVRNIVNDDRFPDLIPFVRYDYYNPQQKVTGMSIADVRAKTSMWVGGIDWRVLNNLVIKADYTTRRIGGGKFVSENEFALGIAWAGWFFNGNGTGVFNKKHKNK